MKSKARSSRDVSPTVATGVDFRLPLLLIGLTTAVYLNSLQLGFAMDAGLLVLDPRLRALTLENLQAILTGPYWHNNPWAGLYRPVTTLSYLFNYSILGSGQDAPGYHLVNLVLHLGNAMMAYVLARRVVGRVWVAWFAAALWAVHPAGTESVTNVAGRADLLAAASVLGGVLWYIRRTERNANPYSSAAVLFAIALVGVFAKENAAVLAGAMLLWDMSHGAGLDRVARRLPYYGAAVAAAALMLAVRSQQPRMLVPLLDNPEVAAGFLGARLTALKVVGHYLLLLAAPLRLSSDYSYNQIPVSGPGDAAGWMWAAAIAALLAAAVLRRTRDPQVFFAAGWFGITLLPVSNLVVPIGSIMAERFVYLPALGFTIAVAALGSRAAGKPAAVAGAVALLLFGARTVARNPDWNNDATLWAANLQAAPGSFKVYKGRATALYDRDPQGNLDEVTRLLETARDIVRNVPVAEQPVNVFTDLGTCYRLLGDRAGGSATEAGRAWYRKSIATLVHARVLDRETDRKAFEAERARGSKLEKVIGMRELYLNLGNAHLNLGEHEAALEAVRYGLRVEPRSPDFYVSIAAVHMARQDRRQAAVALLEQWLAGASSSKTEGQLRGLYSQLPGGECAFAGNTLNPNCPAVHQDMCAAAAGLSQVLEDARRPGEAAAARATAGERYGCGVR